MQMGEKLESPMPALMYTVSDSLVFVESSRDILEALGLRSVFAEAGAARSGLPALARRIPLGAKVSQCAATGEHIGSNRIQVLRVPVKFTKFTNPAECFRDYEYSAARH